MASRPAGKDDHGRRKREGIVIARILLDIDRLDGGRGSDDITVRDGDSLDAVCSGSGADTIDSDPGDRVDDPLVC